MDEYRMPGNLTGTAGTGRVGLLLESRRLARVSPSRTFGHLFFRTGGKDP